VDVRTKWKINKINKNGSVERPPVFSIKKEQKPDKSVYKDSVDTSMDSTIINFYKLQKFKK